MRKPFVAICIAVVLLPLVAGCVKKPPGTKIAGTVSVDGVSVETGLVSFLGTDGNPRPFPIRGGKYEAFLPSGTYEVSFAADKVAREVPRNDFPGDTEMIPEYESIIPPKYKKKGATTITVGEKTAVQDFKLTVGE